MYGTVGLRKRQFFFNRIRRIISMISGYQRQHRKCTMCTPIHAGDQKTADQFTKLFYHTNTNAHVLETISDAFEGALTTGMGLLSVWVDYRSDVCSGDIKVDFLPYNSFLIDPFFRQMDLSDCNNLWTRKYLARPQVEALLPGRKKDIDEIKGWGTRDGKFQFMSEAYNFGSQDLLMYDEFYYLSTRSQKMLVDTETGEATEWKGQDEDLADFMRFYPHVVEFNQTIPTVKLAVVVQGKVMYHGPHPLGIDSYGVIPVWAYYEPHIPYFPLRVQGVVRGLRDAQMLYNRTRINMLDIQESQINSGWVYKENALINPKDVFLSGQGRGLALKAEAQITDVQRIDPPQIPPSMIQLSEFLGQEITQISGINEELLGSADDDKAGILSMLRQGAGLVTLQGLFDNLDRAQKLLGNVFLDIMQTNFTPGKVQRILGEEPSQQFYNRAFGKYDCIVEEASLTSTQKQLAFKTALYLKEIGIPIPTSFLLDNMNIVDKDELIEQIQQNEQAQQQQEQQLAQSQMQLQKVDMETKLAYAEAQKSLAAERLNKTRLDAAISAERLQRSDEERTGSILNLIKGVKEIQQMDTAHIQQAVELIKSIGEDEESGETKEKIESMTDTMLNPQTQQTAEPQQQMQQSPQEAMF